MKKSIMSVGAFRKGGFSLVELMVAAVIIGAGLTAVYTVSSQSMQMMAATYKSSLANQVIKEQLERLKGAAFDSLLSSGSLNSLISSNPLTSGSDLGKTSKFTDTVAISSYTVAGVAATTGTISVRSTVFTTGTQSVATVTSGNLNPATTAVSVQVTLGWTENSGTYSRTSTTLLSKYN